MGWDHTKGATKASIVADLCKTWTTGDGAATYTTVEKAVKGNVMWRVIERKENATGETKRMIGCDLLRSEKGFGWGSKGIGEESGPFYYDCPLRFLDMAPEVRDAEWREGVRKYHETAARKRETLKRLAVGDKLTLVNASIPHVIVIKVSPLRGSFGGRAYTVPPRMIGEIVVPESLREVKDGNS